MKQRFDSDKKRPAINRTPGPVRAWGLVIALTLAYVISFIDRQILNLLVEPIRADLGISDTQVSLLLGFAFAVFYAVAGLPIGRLIDRLNRRNVVVAGIVAWSVMTACCGLARTYVMLFLARIGVGIGEATLLPAAHSMISDVMPRERLGVALSVLGMGVFIGGGLALAGGGAIIAMIEGARIDSLPLLGPMAPWQITFLLVGLPGLLLAPLFLLFREPRRTGLLPVEGADTETRSAGVPLRTVMEFFRQNLGTFGTLFGGTALLALLLHGYAAWIPTFFIRTYGWTASEVGLAYGSVFAVFGLLGVTSGGWLGTVLMRRGQTDAYLRVSLVALLGVSVMGAIAPLMPRASLALAFVAAATFFGSMPLGTTAAAVQSITPNQIRGLATAVSAFAINVLSMGLGPTLVALGTDYVFGYDAALRYSLALLSVVAGPIGAWVIWLGLPRYRRSFAKAAAWIGAD